MFQKQVPDRRGKRTVCLPTCLVFLEIFKEGRPVSEQGGGHVSAHRTRSAQDACPLASTFAKRAVPKEKVPPLQEGVGASGLVTPRMTSMGVRRQGLVCSSRPQTRADSCCQDAEHLRASGGALCGPGLPRGHAGPGLGALTVDCEDSRVLGLLGHEGLLHTLVVFPEKPGGCGGRGHS